MRKYPPHELTMIALTRNDNGTLSVYDIIETSFHYAYGFFRKFERDDEVCELIVRAPGATTERRIQFAKGA